VGQGVACLIVDPSNLAFLSFLAFQRIAETDSDFGFGSGSGSDWLVVDSASFVGSAVVEGYVVMEVVLVLEDVQVDHVMIQVFLDQVVHAVPLVLGLALAPVLVQAASASALDHAQVISKQSSYSVDSPLPDSPSKKRPW